MNQDQNQYQPNIESQFESTVIPFPVYECDHGNREECQYCEELNVWLGIRSAASIVVPLWIVVGLLILWWLL